METRASPRSVESFGLRLATIEGYVPMENLKEIDES